MFVGSCSLDPLLSGMAFPVLLPAAAASTQVYRSIKFAAIHDVARVLEEEAVEAALMERAGRHRSTPLARDVGGHKPRGPKGADLAHRRASLAGRFAVAIRSSVSVARRFTRFHVELGAVPQADMASHGGPVTAPTCGVVSSDVAAPLVAAQQVTPAEPMPDCPAGPNASDERSVRVALASTDRAGAPTGNALSP
jgi:hypothetical protein